MIEKLLCITLQKFPHETDKIISLVAVNEDLVVITTQNGVYSVRPDNGIVGFTIRSLGLIP